MATSSRNGDFPEDFIYKINELDEYTNDIYDIIDSLNFSLTEKEENISKVFKGLDDMEFIYIVNLIESKYLNTYSYLRVGHLFFMDPILYEKLSESID